MLEEDCQKLFDAFYKPLVHFATSIISQADQAEDIVQEVFIYMWEKNIVCKNEMVLRTYLYRAVLNRCKNYLRDLHIRNEHDKLIQLENDKENNEVLNSIIYTEVYRQLSVTIEHLPSQCRKIYEMCQDGMKPSEIAEKLSLAVETVKKQRKIAKKILQNQFGKI